MFTLCACSSKETLLLGPEKSAPRIETLEPEKVDEEEEGKKDESSCSSEEEEDEDSESETEAGIPCLIFRLGDQNVAKQVSVATMF